MASFRNKLNRALLLFIALVFLCFKSSASDPVVLAYPQTGWPCQANKLFALVSNNKITAPDFKVYGQQREIMTGKMTYSGYYWGKHHYLGDISQITNEGIYLLDIPGYAKDTVLVSNYIYKKFRHKSTYIKIPDMIHSFWSFQRCYPEKCNISDEFSTVNFRHADDIGRPLYLQKKWGQEKISLQSKSGDVRGGWHDATSTDKETFDIAISVAAMALSLELITNTVDRQSLMDEMLWGLNYLLKIQDSDGSFIYSVFPYFPWDLPNANLPRQVLVNKATGVAATCAQAFAIASGVLKNTDLDLSRRSLDAAKKAWQWVEKNPNSFDFDNIVVMWSGSAGSILGAATELARVTDEEKYYHCADSLIALGKFAEGGLWVKNNQYTWQPGFAGQLSNSWSPCQPYEAGGSQTPVSLARYYKIVKNVSVKNKVKKLCEDYVDLSKTMATNPYKACETYFWSSFGIVPNLVALSKCLLYIGYELGNTEAIALGVKQYEWATGFNPLGGSFIVGFGKEPLIQPYQREMSNTVGGILPGMRYLKKTLSLRYDGDSIGQTWNRWVISEAGVGIGAASLFDIFGILNKIYNPNDLEATMPTFVQQTEVGDNCILSIVPNPTSNKVNIVYKIKSGKKIELCLYSLSSKKLLSKSLSENEGTFVFDVSNLSTGQYLVVLKADGKRIGNKTFIKQ
jgi:hypothetical protein